MYGPYPAMLPAMLILGGASVWGLLWLPLRYVEQHGLAGGWAALAAFLWPALALLPMLWRQRRKLDGHWRRVLAFGICSGLGFGLYTVGLLFSGVVRVTLLFYLTPVWSALFAMLLLKEYTSWRGWFAALAGLAGLVLMMGAGGEDSIPLNIGDACALASGILWALGVLVLRRHPDTPAIGTVTGQYVFATLCILFFIVLSLDAAPLPDARAWLVGAAVLGLFSSLILMPGLFGIFWAAGRLPPSRVGVLMMSEVLVAVVSAALLADEHMNPLEWTGAMMIIGAALLEVLAGRATDPARAR